MPCCDTTNQECNSGTCQDKSPTPSCKKITEACDTSTNLCCSGLVCKSSKCETKPAPIVPNNFKDLKKSLIVWRPVSGNKSQILNENNFPTWRLTLYNNGGPNSPGSANALISFCKEQGFNRIYLFVGSMEWDDETTFKHKFLPNEVGINNILTQAKANNIEAFALYYLKDSANSIGDPSNTNIADAVHGYNTRYPDAKFTGLLCDQEPDVPDISGIVPDYVFYLNNVKQRLHTLDSSLQLAATIKPTWVHPTSQFQTTVDAIDFPVIMAYQNYLVSIDNDHNIEKYDPSCPTNLGSGIYHISCPVVAYAQSKNKPVEIAIETGWENIGSTGEISFNEVIQGDVTDDTTKFQDTMIDIAKHYPGVPIAIHSFDQYFFVQSNVGTDHNNGKIIQTTPYWYPDEQGTVNITDDATLKAMLVQAITGSDIQTVQTIISNGFGINTVINTSGDTPINLAAKHASTSYPVITNIAKWLANPSGAWADLSKLTAPINDPNLQACITAINTCVNSTNPDDNKTTSKLEACITKTKACATS